MNRPNVFITSFFRTRHQHFTESLKRYLGYSKATIVGANHHGDDEHVINVHQAQVLFPMEGLIFDEHLKASGNSAAFLSMYKIRPIVMLRDLPSCLADLKENFDAGNSVPGLQRPVYWDKLDHSKRFSWIAYNATPWFLSFYVSWMQSSLPKYIIWSEDYDSVPAAVLNGSIGFVNQIDMPGVDPFIWQHQVGPTLGLGAKLPKECFDIIYGHMESWGTKWEQIMREELFRGD